MRAGVLFLAFLSLGFLASCGERDQVSASGPAKGGKYQGKPDTQSWANTPLAAEWRGGTWKQGDRASWEESIRTRQLAQHEHKRIYQ